MCVCVTKPAWCSARGPGARAGGMKLKFSIHVGRVEGGKKKWDGGGGAGDEGGVGETKDNREAGEEEDLMTGGTASLQSGGGKQKANVLGQIENVPCINDAWPLHHYEGKKAHNPARLTLTTCHSYIIMRVDSPRGRA